MSLLLLLLLLQLLYVAIIALNVAAIIDSKHACICLPFGLDDWAIWATGFETK